MLLLRALVARFWREPYRGRAGPWGTALHDRWLLPHFVAADIRDVVARSATRRLPRSSRRGSSRSSSSASRATAPSTYDGITLELRQAIEPWHVLGEEIERQRHGALRRLVGRAPAGQGHRHDRRPPRRHLQRPRAAARRRPACRASSSPACASARGARRRRCIRRSACRRRSRSTSSTPGRSARSAAAPTTSSHPGGRNYDTFPVNANEAEARRFARFWAHGHTPGPMHVTPEPANPRRRRRSICAGSRALR